MCDLQPVASLPIPQRGDAGKGAPVCRNGMVETQLLSEAQVNPLIAAYGSAFTQLMCANALFSHVVRAHHMVQVSFCASTSPWHRSRGSSDIPDEAVACGHEKWGVRPICVARYLDGLISDDSDQSPGGSELFSRRRCSRHRRVSRQRASLCKQPGGGSRLGSAKATAQLSGTTR